MGRFRIVINNDFFNIFQIEGPVSDEDVLAAVDKVADSQVDAIAVEIPFLLFDQSYLDDELAQLYTRPDGDTCLANIAAFRESGKDPIQMLIERAKQRNMSYFGSIRMNDTHYKDHLFNPWVPQFFYDNQHNLLAPFSNSREDTEYDYRKSAVRDYMLGHIREFVETYDVDGIELNFTRNCRLFPQPFAEECAPVLTQWLQELKNFLKEIGDTRGKPILLSAMVPAGLLSCRQQGLDITTWARLKLIDMLCLSTQFTVDIGRDIHDIRQKVPGLEIYAGCDRNLSWGNGNRVVPMETYRAMAMTFLRNGADGIHLFNVMSWTQNLDRLNEAVKQHGGHGDTTGAPLDYDRELIHELGTVETLADKDKLYLVSSGWDSPEKPLQSLPVTVPAGEDVTVRLQVGDDIAAAAERGCIESIELQTISSDCRDYNNYTVKLNCIDLSRQYAFAPFADVPEAPLLYPEPGRTGELPEPEFVRRHRVRPIDLHMGYNYVTIKSYKQALTIIGVEIAIRYKS